MSCRGTEADRLTTIRKGKMGTFTRQTKDVSGQQSACLHANTEQDAQRTHPTHLKASHTVIKNGLNPVAQVSLNVDLLNKHRGACVSGAPVNSSVFV